MDTKIPYRQDRFAVQKSRHGKEYTISFCFPYLADNEQVDANEFMAKGAIRKTLIENIAWDTAPFFDDGESRSADLADYDVEFVVPSDYEVAAVGKSELAEAAGTTDTATDAADAADAADASTYSIKATNVRDFAIVACNHMEKETFDVNGVTVNSYYLTGGNETDEYRKICNLSTEESIKLFTEKIGPYPYEELDVVECLFGFAFGGMEYPGLVMINGNSFFEGMGAEFGAQPLVDVVSHEIGHQWFYSAVGNNEYREGWIDEAFATYAERELFNMADNETNAYLRELDKDILSFEEIQADRADYLKYFKQEFDNYYINIAPDEYERDRSYGEGEYEAGFLFLVELKQLWGEARFDEFLKTYFKNYSGHIAETKDIVALIRAFDVNGAAEDTIKYFIKE